MRTTAAGLNFIDTFHRSGLYPVPLPSGLGLESAGVVAAVGPGVEGLAPGDPVAAWDAGLGAYATRRNVPAHRLFRLPDAIDDGTTQTLGATLTMPNQLAAAARVNRMAPGFRPSSTIGTIEASWQMAE